MKKSDANIHFLFPILLIASAGLQCLADGPSASPVASEQTCSLVRISEEQISLQNQFIVNQFQKSDKIRVGVKLGSYVVCAAAIAGLYYELFAPVRATTVPKDLNAYSLEQLIVLVGKLAERVRRLEIGPNFFSWEYCKSFIYSIIWSPSTILDVSRFLLNKGDSYLKHNLYSTNLGWFINEKTRLGLLCKRDTPSSTNFEFEVGQLPKDIEKCAVALDGVTRNLLPTDVAYQRRHMIECCNTLVEDISKLIAFIKYIDTLTDNEKSHFENAECIRYLINCANSFCEGIEDRLNEKSDEKLLPLVTAFNSELQPIMIRFAESIK